MSRGQGPRVGEIFKRQRIASGLSLRETVARCRQHALPWRGGISLAQLCNIEAGRTAWPHLATIRSLAAVYHIPLIALVEELFGISLARDAMQREELDHYGSEL